MQLPLECTACSVRCAPVHSHHTLLTFSPHPPHPPPPSLNLPTTSCALCTRSFCTLIRSCSVPWTMGTASSAE
eukprot:scaffold33109_cov23-Tisochrysis_lutea.AAC.3